MYRYKTDSVKLRNSASAGPMAIAGMVKHFALPCLAVLCAAVSFLGCYSQSEPGNFKGPAMTYANSVFVHKGIPYATGAHHPPCKGVPQGPGTAMLWGGLAVVFQGKLPSVATAVYVTDDGTYCVGQASSASFDLPSTEAPFTETAFLRVNGQMQRLYGTDRSMVTYANSVFVDAGDVYVAGYGHETNGRPVNIAILWKNGEPVGLTDGSAHTEANSVCASDGDVYVCGNEFADYTRQSFIPMLWKNGHRIDLPTDGGDRIYAHGVFAYSGDVYLLGAKYEANSNRGETVLWKNNVLQSGAYSSYADLVESIFVSGDASCAIGPAFVDGSDVYTAGATDRYRGDAVVWKNGVAITLPPGKDK